MGRAGKMLARGNYKNPPKAAADATSVKIRKPDNILKTMDKHGASDVVRHLSKNK